MTPPLIAHLEQYVGQIRGGWSQDADGQPLPFQVVELDNGATPDIVTCATVGLSNVALASGVPDKKIRHELLMMRYVKEQGWAVPGILQEVGLAALERSSAYLRGEVIGPHGPLCPGSSMEALYVSTPNFFPDEFASLEAEIGSVIFAWLVPIGPNEAAYVRSHGWKAFEDRLVEQNPNLFDVMRPELAVCRAVSP